MVKMLTETKDLYGKVPKKLLRLLVSAVSSADSDIFFSRGRVALKVEVKEFDEHILRFLKKKCGEGEVEQNHKPFEDKKEIDLWLKKDRVLIEIEKGQYPRLEFDIFKIMSACIQNPKRYRYGVLIVPSSYIKLRLQGKDAPWKYLTERFSPMVRPIFDNIKEIKGFAVIGYRDPREAAMSKENSRDTATRKAAKQRRKKP